MEQQDLIIIGAGPAGLSAGIHAGYRGLKALILEENISGGLAAEIPVLENYPGLNERISGGGLINKMAEQCKKYEVGIHEFEKVIKLNFEGADKLVQTDKSEYKVRNVIIASGGHAGKLEAKGEEEFRGKGVSYCAVCDSAFFRNKKVAVAGEGSPAVEVTLYLSEVASSAVLVCVGPEIEAEKILTDRLIERNIEVLTDMEVKEIKGETLVKSIVVSDKKTGDTREMETDGVFFQLEEIPNSELAGKSGVKTDDKGYIIVDGKGKTNIDNVYAIGDVTNHPVKKVITAAAQATVSVDDILRAWIFNNGTR